MTSQPSRARDFQPSRARDLRILHVIPWLSPRYGGPAILVPQAAVRLTSRGHDVEIVTTIADQQGVLDVRIGRAVDWAGAVATFHPLSAPRAYLTSWRMLADLFRRTSTFDVIHINCLYRFHGLAAASMARAHDVPYVIQAHGSLDPWHRDTRSLVWGGPGTCGSSQPASCQSPRIQRCRRLTSIA